MGLRTRASEEFVSVLKRLVALLPQICLEEVCPREVCSSEVCPREVCFGEVCFREVRSFEVCSSEVRPLEVCLGEVCPYEVCSSELCVCEERLDDTIGRLMGARVVVQLERDGKPYSRSVPLLEHLDQPIRGDGKVYYQFPRKLRKLIANKSCHQLVSVRAGTNTTIVAPA